MITPLPQPMYYGVACFNNGPPQKGFWVVETGADKNSASYKNFVQIAAMTAMVATPDGLVIASQFGEVNVGFGEITFTGTGYTIGTVRSKDPDYFQALASPPMGPNITEQTSKAFVIPSTNYAVFGMRIIALGFRASKNGDNMPNIDVYNSLFCAPEMLSLH